MIASTSLFALSLAAGVGALAVRILRPVTLLQADSVSVAADHGEWRRLDGVAQILACACLVLAMAALLESWASSLLAEDSEGAMRSAAWGALWVYLCALIVEWRLGGLADATRGVATSLCVALLGVMMLGGLLTFWPTVVTLDLPACQNGGLAINTGATRLRLVIGLGATLVTLVSAVSCLPWRAGVPLAPAGAVAALAIWLLPAMPYLGWLPLEALSGAMLAAALMVPLLCLRFAWNRGSVAIALGLVFYFVLGIAGVYLLTSI